MSDIDEKIDLQHDEKADKTQHIDTNAKDVEVVQVFNARYAAAVRTDAVNGKSRESIILYLSCAVSFLCACANGYDGSLMTAILAMSHFQSTFRSGSTGSTVSLIFSIYTVGSMVGAFSAGPLSDRFGRRVGMFCGGCVIIFGSIVISTAKHIPQLVVGRFILGWGISIMTVAAPAYCVEIAPPNWRGRMMGIYNCGWFGGSVPAAATTFGTNYINSNWSWRIPLLLQMVPSVVVLCSVFFIRESATESPRWLMANGRDEEARAFLVRFHGNKNPDSAMVALEWEEFKENIALDGSDKRWWDYRPLFLTHSGRWRISMVLMISVFGQFSGNGLGYFNTVIFNNLGYTSSVTQLGLNLCGEGISAIAAVTAATLTDRMHRRPVLIWGTLGSALCLLVHAVLSLKWAQQETIPNPDKAGEVIYVNPNLALGQGAVAAFFLFKVVFSFAYTPLQGAYPAECLESTARAKGMGISGFIVSGIGFINQFAGPIALQNIKNNYAFVFVGWDTVEALCWYLFGVETQGRTLEQLQDIFDSPNPVKASKHRDTLAIKDEGDHIAVVEQI